MDCFSVVYEVTNNLEVLKAFCAAEVKAELIHSSADSQLSFENKEEEIKTIFLSDFHIFLLLKNPSWHFVIH